MVLTRLVKVSAMLIECTLDQEPNPRVAVSPWMNSTIGADLTRKSLGDEKLCGTEVGEPSNVVGNMPDTFAAPVA